VDAALMDSIHGLKTKTGPNNKIGNVHLKWAFSEAACLFLRKNLPAKLHHRPKARAHCVHHAEKEDAF
jgi:hypothetical protein